jgi:hypothetical protein
LPISREPLTRKYENKMVGSAQDEQHLIKRTDVADFFGHVVAQRRDQRASR